MSFEAISPMWRTFKELTVRQAAALIAGRGPNVAQRRGENGERIEEPASTEDELLAICVLINAISSGELKASERESKISVDDLRMWLENYGIRPMFFFDVESNDHGKEPEAVSDIKGAAFERLQRAITAFPARYSDYQSQPPKLKDDVRPWLKEAGLAGNDREAHVFGTIIAEHFKLLGDTHET